MLSRENFIFTIGYDGDTALVDARAKKKYKNASAIELAELGLFRAAWASAVHAQSDEAKLAVLAVYNRRAGSSLDLSSHVGRLFGVHLIEASRVKLI